MHTAYSFLVDVIDAIVLNFKRGRELLKITPENEQKLNVNLPAQSSTEAYAVLHYSSAQIERRKKKKNYYYYYYYFIYSVYEFVPRSSCRGNK